MKHVFRVPTLALLSILVLALAAAPPALAADGTAYDALTEHYEPIRQALLHDHLDGVSDHAEALADTAADLREDLSAERAGVPADKLAEVKVLLPKLEGAARKLAGAGDLEEARRVFGELSEPMVLYHELVPGDELVVAYCPMVEESWLQPDGDLGNPYMGQRMAKCGKKVGD